MSQQKDLLREIAAAINSDALDRMGDWFTEDFVLHEPGLPALPTGHQGARHAQDGSRACHRNVFAVEAHAGCT
jgi:hypothetical protein